MKKFLPQAVFISALLLIAGVTVFAQSRQNEDFEILPGSATIGFSTNEIAEFKAYYQGEDVTSQTTWINAGLTSSEQNRAVLVGPGKFRSGTEPGSALIRATYNDFDAFATVQVQGQIVAGGLRIRGEDEGASVIDVGEEISLRLEYAPMENCSGTNCSPDYDDVTSQSSWSSSNPAVLQSLGAGRFRGVSDGTTQITASYQGGSRDKVMHVGTASGNSSAYDVYLTQRTPVFTRLDIPTGYDTAFGHFPFENISWIPDSNTGYFQVGGNCASGAGADAAARRARDNFESGGMWVFDENGEFLDQADVCHDTADVTPGCFEAGGCANGFKIQPVGNGQFIRDLGTKEYGPDRSPVLYKIENGRIEKLNQLFFNSFRNQDGGSRIDEDLFTYVAYANGKMIGVEEIDGSSINLGNAIYSIPEMGRLAEFSEPVPFCRECSGSRVDFAPHYYPLLGVGDYFIAVQRNSYWSGPHEIYRMPDSTELLSGELPEKVGEINSGNLVHFAYDTQDANRVALLLSPVGSIGATGLKTVEIYRATDEGLILEQTINSVPAWGSALITKDFRNAFAFSGEYIAFKNCQDRACEVRVMKGNENLSVEPMPLLNSSYREVKAIEISPTGKMMVSSRDFQSDVSDELFVYQIGEATGQPVVPPGTFPPGGFGPGIGQGQGADFNFYLNMADDLLKGIGISLRGGVESEGSVQSFGPTTEEGIKQFQCRYGIVCSGTKETTGWGNLGPQTQAKIQEVYGGTSADTTQGSFNLYDNTSSPAGSTGSFGGGGSFQDQINSLIQSFSSFGGN